MLMHGREPDELGGPQISRLPKFGEVELCWIMDQESSNRAVLVNAIVASNTAVNPSLR